ncbi:hint module-domain-containing protein [Endogone sp. FLAS-F59071]|nr:hint module-domain-containing protein [Endogone sp. FLAS-F59071]|eukprot:RUS19659.1 hint module-domain-containing protein [Endogone sp. FLAS-F59071]
MIIAFSKCNKNQTIHNDVMFSQSKPIKKLVNATGNRWVISPNPDIFGPETEEFKVQFKRLVDLIKQMKTPYTTELFVRVRQAREKEIENQNMEMKRREEAIKEKEKEFKLQEKINSMKEMEELNKKYLHTIREMMKLHKREMDNMQKKIDEAGARAAKKAFRDKGDSCFAIDTIVTTSDGEHIPLSQIKVGDQILSRGASGNLEYSEVYLIVDHSTQGLTKYHNIHFTKPDGSQGNLRLTPDHHIFVNSTIDFAENVLADSSKIQILHNNSLISVFVDDVTMGTYIILYRSIIHNSHYIIHPTSSPTGTKEWQSGYISILTRSGNFIADGVLCSCFCQTPPSIAMQTLGQIAFAPLRLYTRFFPSVYRSAEVHPYPQTLVNIVLAFNNAWKAITKNANAAVAWSQFDTLVYSRADFSA